MSIVWLLIHRIRIQHTVRCGEVSVSIFRRQSNAGYLYRDFTFSRYYQSVATGKELHGTGFFESHEADLMDAVRRESR